MEAGLKSEPRFVDATPRRQDNCNGNCTHVGTAYPSCSVDNGILNQSLKFNEVTIEIEIKNLHADSH